MYRRKIIRSIPVLFLVWLSSCDSASEISKPDARAQQAEMQPVETTTRWYNAEQVAEGEPLFQTHCASCHMPDASGTKDWKQTDANGNYPPPPLNGTAHTWHHALSVLQRTIRNGGEPLGGVMPGFDKQLDDRQIDAILAWIQSQWTDDIYATWAQIDAQSR